VGRDLCSSPVDSGLREYYIPDGTILNNCDDLIGSLNVCWQRCWLNGT